MADKAHQAGADIEDVLDFRRRQRRHLGTALRQDRHQALSFDGPQRLAHRCPADAEAAGEVDFAQLFSRGEFTVDDRLPDPHGDLGGQGGVDPIGL